MRTKEEMMVHMSLVLQTYFNEDPKLTKFEIPVRVLTGEI